MKILFLVIASLVALFSSGSCDISTTCPPAENVYPCTCIPFATGIHITCKDIEDTEVLIDKFKVLREYKVGKLFLHGLMLKQVLPGNIFRGLKIYELQVTKSNLMFAEPAFSGLDESLNLLNVMENSTINSSENFLIAKLINLSKLNFNKNSLVTVRNEWFNGRIPNVKHIELDDNNISKIENKAFASLSKLESVSIAENKIKRVERSMLPRPAKYLKRIDLSSNKIASLPMDFFHQMPKLEEVVLNQNRLTTLREMVWKPVWQDLRIVLLKKNQLICDTNLDWLKDFRWPKEVSGVCYIPPEREGKSLNDVYKT